MKAIPYSDLPKGNPRCFRTCVAMLNIDFDRVVDILGAKEHVGFAEVDADDLDEDEAIGAEGSRFIPLLLSNNHSALLLEHVSSGSVELQLECIDHEIVYEDELHEIVDAILGHRFILRSTGGFVWLKSRG